MDGTLAQQAYEFIRDRIINGEYAPGTRLVVKKLCDESGFGVSPMRDAVNRVAAVGLGERKNGASVFVSEGSVASLDHLYDVRIALEGLAASEAARHATDMQIEYLDVFADQAAAIAARIGKSKTGHATKPQMEKWLSIEKVFHDLIVTAARNPLLKRMVAEYHAVSQVFDAVEGEPKLLTNSVAKGTCESNEKLMEAIRARDSDGARAAMVNHIELGRRVVASYLFGR